MKTNTLAIKPENKVVIHGNGEKFLLQLKQMNMGKRNYLQTIKF